ncbi:hypothetical protein KHQ81_11560 [Mycoplasmatota bacterium]|nr:hypothetical protein KHQ81_11560 [Mycoplasmatota bacterium]
MIEEIIKKLVKIITRKIGNKINTSMSEKVSQKKAQINEKFEYELKHAKNYIICGLCLCLIGLGLLIYSLVIYFQDIQYNNLLICFILGVVSFILSIMIIINYYKYKISYNNTLLTKKTPFSTKEIRWDDITDITVSNNHQIILTTSQNKITCKPILIGMVDFIYVIYTKFGKETIYSLCRSSLVHKTVNQMIRQYEIDLDCE